MILLQNKILYMKNMEPDNCLYDRKRVKSIIARVRRPGGIPWGDAQVDKLTSWFRMLATRGLTEGAVLANPKVAAQKFEESFPNPVSRSQYIRAFMNYLTGLTDAEFDVEYPTVERNHLVDLLKSVTHRAGVERRIMREANAQTT